VSDERIRLHDWLLEQLGKPYLWAAKGMDAFDCSGLATCGLLAMGCPDWRQTHNSSKLWAVLPPTREPMPMDLSFYGPPGLVTHVMFVWGDGRVYGACGGGRLTTTLAIAHVVGAKVRFRSRVDYRPDHKGFRRIPLM
jgi:hypothetical protein